MAAPGTPAGTTEAATERPVRRVPARLVLRVPEAVPGRPVPRVPEPVPGRARAPGRAAVPGMAVPHQAEAPGRGRQVTGSRALQSGSAKPLPQRRHSG